MTSALGTRAVRLRWYKPGMIRGRGTGALGPVAAAFVTGAAAGFEVPLAVSTTIAVVTAAVAARLSDPRRRLGFLAVMAAACGAALAQRQVCEPGPHRIDAGLVRVEGVAVEPSRELAGPGGPLARFLDRGPRTLIRCAPDTRPPEWPRTILAYVDGRTQVRRGDRVELQGVIRTTRRPANPGVPQRHARPVISVPDPGLVRVTRVDHPAIHLAAGRIVDDLRRRARDLLDASGSPERAALLAALLLGRREPALADTSEAFRRLGVAHLLAVSGLHLSIVVGLTLIAAGGARQRGRRAIITLLVVGAYVALVEPRPPVWRAGAMAAVGALGLASRRRWTAEGLLALAAIPIVAHDPYEARRAGFQLSFIVVLALVRLAPRVRARWFGPRAGLAGHPGDIVRECTRDALAMATTAWAVSTPLVMHHFGVIAPFGVIASVAVSPLIAPLLATGYGAMVLEPISTVLGAALMRACGLGAQALVDVVRAAAHLPGARLRVRAPGVPWTLAAIAWVWIALPGPDFTSAVRRTGRRGLLALTGAGLAAIAVLGIPRPVLRVDVLAVGEGTCVLVGSDGRHLLFDAGTRSNPRIARVIVPALRRLGVVQLDGLAVSHAHIDHYGAALDVLDAFGPCPVYITPHMLAAAASDPHGADACFLAELERSGCQRVVASRGTCIDLGAARIDCLHPDDRDRYPTRNDESLVLSVAAGGVRLILAGDIGPRGLADLRPRYDGLRADIVEVPHHGALEPAAESWLAVLQPLVAFQSCGPRRLERLPALRMPPDCTLMVTARDGACSITLRNGALELRAESRPFRPDRRLLRAAVPR